MNVLAGLAAGLHFAPDGDDASVEVAGAARTKALYQWLMQQTAEAGTVIVNDKTFADNITLTVGNKSNGIYEASISFTIAGMRSAPRMIWP